MSGVASRNPFALLGDADDVAAASTPAAPKPAATPVAPVKAKPTSAPTPARTNNRSGGRGGARGGAAAPRGDAEGAAASEQKDVRAGSAKTVRGESRGRGGRGRGERGGRGRAFDRHSQTGKEDTEKKIAQGWGAQDGETELAAEENGKADAEVEVAEGAATPAANGTASERPAPIPEEEDNTKTLDEYLAEQTAKRAQLGVAKAEGREINQSAWDKLQATKVDKTKAEEDYFAAKEKASKGPRARKEKQFVEIDTRFETPASTRGGSERGGRGGARGGSERGARGGRGRGRGEGRGGARGARGGSSASPQVNLADQSAFPSLA